MTKPKSETMWMAWHKDLGFIPFISGGTWQECEGEFHRLQYVEGRSMKLEAIEVQITEIQPKKRGRG